MILESTEHRWDIVHRYESVTLRELVKYINLTLLEIVKLYYYLK
jgi:hypothetical protein